MKSRILLILFLVALLPAAAGCGDSPALGTIRGVVRDADNTLLPGVTVTVYKNDIPDPVKSVVSNSTGEYTIADLEAGAALNLEYTKDGYVPKTASSIILERKEFRLLPDEVMNSLAGTVTILGTVVLE